MRVVIQRVKNASVLVNSKVVGKCQNGLLIYLGVTDEDNTEDIDYLVKKSTELRIFNDDDGKMNLSLEDIGGSILLISQFTLYANTKKGRRPSYNSAAKPDYANEMYELFKNRLLAKGFAVETGIFGEHMDVEYTNSGPVTIIIDSKNR